MKLRREILGLLKYVFSFKLHCRKLCFISLYLSSTSSSRSLARGTIAIPEKDTCAGNGSQNAKKLVLNHAVVQVFAEKSKYFFPFYLPDT